MNDCDWHPRDRIRATFSFVQWQKSRESQHDGVGAGTQDDVGFVLLCDIRAELERCPLSTHCCRLDYTRAYYHFLLKEEIPVKMAISFFNRLSLYI
jgi:hypothetical protein